MKWRRSEALKRYIWLLLLPWKIKCATSPCVLGCWMRLSQSHLMEQIAYIIIPHAWFPSATLRLCCCLTETMCFIRNSSEMTRWETAEVTELQSRDCKKINAFFNTICKNGHIHKRTCQRRNKSSLNNLLYNTELLERMVASVYIIYPNLQFGSLVFIVMIKKRLYLKIKPWKWSERFTEQNVKSFKCLQ